VLQCDCEIFAITADSEVTDFTRCLCLVNHLIWNQLNFFAPDVAHQVTFISSDLEVGHFVIFVNLDLQVFF